VYMTLATLLMRALRDDDDDELMTTAHKRFKFLCSQVLQERIKDRCWRNALTGSAPPKMVGMGEKGDQVGEVVHNCD